MSDGSRTVHTFLSKMLQVNLEASLLPSGAHRPVPKLRGKGALRGMNGLSKPLEGGRDAIAVSSKRFVIFWSCQWRRRSSWSLKLICGL